MDITGVYKEVNGDNQGVDITGLVKRVDGSNKGADITAGIKVVGGDNKGLSITGLYNQFEKINDWSIAYATLGNNVKKVGENAFYFHVGLINRTGNSYSPLINVGGVKNIPRLMKNVFKKKGKLEDNLE